MPAFNPPATIAEQILIDLACPETTLRDIALRASTSLDELCLWLASPAIAARTSAIESAMFAKARLTAANHLPFIVHAAAELLRAFLDEDRATSDPKLRHRAREAARKAMHLLTRLARITPHPPGEVPGRRGGGGSAPPSSSPSPLSPSSPAQSLGQDLRQDPAQSLAQDPAQSLAPAPAPNHTRAPEASAPITPHPRGGAPSPPPTSPSTPAERPPHTAAASPPTTPIVNPGITRAPSAHHAHAGPARTDTS